MRKVFVLLAVLLIADQALAAPQSFDSPLGSFSVDVPRGWTATQMPAGCQLTSGWQDDSMVFQFSQVGTMKDEELARNLATAMGMKNAKASRQDGVVFIDGTVGTNPVLVAVYVSGMQAMTVVMSGADRETMYAVYGSLKIE